MDRETELQLIDELLAIKSAGSFYLDEAVSENRVEHYTDPARFELERARIFRKVPLAIAHASKLAQPGDFVRREIAGLPVLLTRDKQGEAHAFLNVCRHRGTRLVEEEAGCKHRFTCPYHAWTYSSAGDLIAAPHFKDGFTGREKSEFGLKRLDFQERHGLLWVTPEPDTVVDIDQFLGPLAPEIAALEIDEMFVVQCDTLELDANWKLIVEGGIEAYHFKVAHRSTIGPYFEDNLSSYRMFGPHMRSILMRSSMARLDPETRESWRLRDHAQVLYNLFPSATLLVQQDHVAWITNEPLAAGKTRLRITTLAPKAEAAKTEHWAQNHAITRETLDEDFTLNESMQASMASGANEHLTFGRFEGALDAYNRVVEAFVSGSSQSA